MTRLFESGIRCLWRDQVFIGKTNVHKGSSCRKSQSQSSRRLNSLSLRRRLSTDSAMWPDGIVKQENERGVEPSLCLR